MPRRWFVLFRERAPGVVEIKIVEGVESEKQQLVSVAFKDGWHGIWVFDREVEQAVVAQQIAHGKAIGELPGAIELLLNGQLFEQGG